MRLATRHLARKRSAAAIEASSPHPATAIPSAWRLASRSLGVAPMPTPPLLLESAGCSIVGRRKNNEDSLLVRPQLGLFAVADGMGGYEGGEIASATIVETLDAFIARIERDPDGTWPTRARRSVDPLEALVDAAMRMAEREVRARRFGKLSRMGSTATLALFRDRKLVLGHVGDTRVYRLREGLEQLTYDHSVAAELGRAGVGAANVSPSYLACLTRAIGMDTPTEIELRSEDVQRGDAYLLCSDGLWGAMEDGEIAEIMRGRSIGEVCTTLVDAAHAGGSHDNITAVAIRVC
jgi:serine/threonine protein phosphatase PrpC